MKRNRVMSKADFEKHKAAKKADFSKRHKINQKSNRKRQGGKYSSAANRRRKARKANKT